MAFHLSRLAPQATVVVDTTEPLFLFVTVLIFPGEYSLSGIQQFFTETQQQAVLMILVLLCDGPRFLHGQGHMLLLVFWDVCCLATPLSHWT